MSAAEQCSWKEKILNNVEIPILTKCCFCFPLRIGLIVFSYFNIAFSLLATIFLIMYINSEENIPAEVEISRLTVDVVGIILEMLMTVFFIVALHRKQVLMMKIYLYFEIIYSITTFVYSMVYLTKETASELFLILFQMVLQLYFVILIWSSLVKMKRNVSVNYRIHNDNA